MKTKPLGHAILVLDPAMIRCQQPATLRDASAIRQSMFRYVPYKLLRRTICVCRFLHCLKPGGQVLISDYCCSQSAPSPSFAAYMQQRKYDLHTVDAYGRMLQDAGFCNVEATDCSAEFGKTLQMELERFEASRDALLQDGLSPEDYEVLASGWREKKQRVDNGEQRWGVFRAFKPS